jgi:predicted transposase/invertase (TIGR01784 family)
LTDDLAFHLLELPTFTKSATELSSGLDVWLYFLRHAEKMDTEALPAALEQPLVRRALEELKMLSQTDVERERYEARRKAQLDYSTGLKVTRLEGREEGRREGREEGCREGQKIGLVSTIHLCERLLHRPETPTEQLTALPLDDLTRLADELQSQVQPDR